MRTLAPAPICAAVFLAFSAPQALAAEPREVESPQEPEWAREIQRKLKRKVSFEFKDTPLTEAVAFLQFLTKANMIFDPEAAEAKGWEAVTLKVTNERLDAALRQILAPAGLDYGLADRAILISTPERLAAMRKQEAEARREATRRADGVWELAIKKKLSRKVTFEFIDTPLTEALQFLQTLTDSTIICDPVASADKYETPITLNVANMPLSVALRWILKLVDLDYGLVDGAAFISTPKRIVSTRRALHARRFAENVRPDEKWSRAIRRKLRRRVTFEFAETPFGEAIAFLRTLTGTNMILDPRAAASKRPVTLKVTNMPLDAALRWMCLIAGCDYALFDKAIFISTPERTATELLRSAERRAADAARQDAVPESERELRRKLERSVSFEFVETPLGRAIEFFGTLAEMPFALAPAAERARATPVTLKVTNMPFSDALGWTCRLAGCDYSLADGAIRVGPAEETAWRSEIIQRLARKVTISFDGVPTYKHLKSLQALAGMPFVVDSAGRQRWSGRPRGEVKDAPLADALAHILESCGLSYALIDQAVFVSTPERTVQVARLEAARLDREAAHTGAVEWWERELQRTLDGRVSLRVHEKPFGEALTVLARASGLAISIDPDRDGPFVPDRVTLEVEGLSAGAALRWLCRLGGADYRLTEGGVLVSTPATFRRREIEAALAKRISFDVNIHFADVLELVGTLAGVPVRLDPDLREDYNAITFKADDLTGRAALDWLARVGELEWAVRDGAVFVSTPEVMGTRP